ncbi:MAG: hypothetical protein PHF11_00375 [Candidatus Omnitrophica bacterium]|nr:hypothetical protein [Candidatus Omnitrophota bacterium]
MDAIKTKSLDKIEHKMEEMDKNSLRYKILENARNFKTSWIELGRALYSAWKDKLYKEWGYNSFDTYTSREIGIRKQTALKLLRSYYFLEKEEPHYLKSDYTGSAQAAEIPSYESVDVLRLAKNKKSLDEEDYDNLKKSVFEKGKDAREVKRDLISLMRQREELEPEEAREKKKTAQVRRLIGALKSLKNEIGLSKTLPHAIIKDLDNLIDKLESEIG